MRRLARYASIAILISLVSGVVAHALNSTSWQGWTDNQSGAGQFELFNVTDVSDNRLNTGGPVYSVRPAGQIVSVPAAWSVTDWYIDPQSRFAICDNANGGTTSGAPICSFGELANRLYGAIYGFAVTIHLQSDSISTDNTYFRVQITKSGSITIAGNPSSPIYSGAVTSYTPVSTSAAVDDNELVDSSIPVSFTASGLLADGVFFQRTNSTPVYWWAAKDLGSKTLRTSDVTDDFGLVSLSPGDAYAAVSLPKIYNVRFQEGNPGFSGAVTFSFVTLNDASGSPGVVKLINCAYPASATGPNIYAQQMINCGFGQAANFGQKSNGVMVVNWGLFKSNSGSICSISGGALQVGGTVFQAIRLAIGQQAKGWIVSRISFYDSLNPTGFLFVRDQSELLIASGGAIGGVGNESPIIITVRQSSVTYDTPFAAGITSVTDSMVVDGNAYPVSALPVIDVNGGSRIAPAAPPLTAGCMQSNGSGFMTSTGVACGTGSGTITALTHDVIASGTGSVPANVVGIENDAIMRGDIIAASIPAPPAPAPGNLTFYGDSTQNVFYSLDDTGRSTHTVQTLAAATHKFLTSIQADGGVTNAQPSYGDISGTPVACTDYVSLLCVTAPTDLSNTNAHPFVSAIHETSGPTQLTIAAIPDSAPHSTTLIRPAGTAQVVGVDTNTLVTTVPLVCSQQPAFTGDSTKPSGSCVTKNVALTETSGPTSLTVAAIPDSAPHSTVLIRPSGTAQIVGIDSNTFVTTTPLVCSQTPAFTGDSTKASGSCVTKNVALTETSGPASLAVGAIPSTASASVVLRPFGTNTLVGIPQNLLAVTVVEGLAYSVGIGAGSSFPGSGYFQTSSNNNLSASLGPSGTEYNLAVTGTAVKLNVFITTSALLGGLGSYTLSITQNGTVIAGTTLTFVSGSLGQFASSWTTVSGTSADTYGLYFTDSGVTSVGSTISFQAVASVQGLM